MFIQSHFKCDYCGNIAYDLYESRWFVVKPVVMKQFRFDVERQERGEDRYDTYEYHFCCRNCLEKIFPFTEFKEKK